MNCKLAKYKMAGRKINIYVYVDRYIRQRLLNRSICIRLIVISYLFSRRETGFGQELVSLLTWTHKLGVLINQTISSTMRIV